jgi:hypothetical protein
MGFQGRDRAGSDLPDSFWSRFTPVPGHVFGLVGLLAALAVSGTLAVRAFRRADVAG